jgi:dipeptidyl-peptidase-4
LDAFMTQVSYPRLNARTQRFTLGRPRSFTVSPDGRRIVFVRSGGGTDRVGRLWSLDTETGAERELVDPTALLAGGDEELSTAERARRERMRESAGGVVGYATDRVVGCAVFALSGRLFLTDLDSGETSELPAQSPAIDPRLDPTGRWVAYASQGALRVVAVDGTGDRALVEPDGDDVVWGLADFVAAEELDRSRGFWWSPLGDQLLVERYDESPVQTWYVSDPTHPSQPATPQRYPAAGTRNAEVSVWLVRLDGHRSQVTWDADEWEYVAGVDWSDRGDALVQLLDRRQKRTRILAVTAAGETWTVREWSDDCWVDVMPGVPTWGFHGELITIEPVDGRYALCADGSAVTPATLQVRGLIDVGNDDVLLLANEHPLEQHLVLWSPTGTTAVTTEPGVNAGTRSGATTVMVTASLSTPVAVTQYRTASKTAVIASHAATPPFTPNVTVLPGGVDDLRVAVVMPSGWRKGHGPLPVLLDPYGGPHGQQVLSAQSAYRDSQWFADQGFAVVVVDGHGTPGSPSWERAIRGDFATRVLDDQVSGLHAAAHAFPDFDLGKVAIRGWSFGGFLSALAVLDRPDVFHAAVVGAPVTDWHLYDTGYTERYLGLPDEQPDAYLVSSVLERAATLSRPLQLIHGFADDNVFVANSLQLSQVLTENGRRHEVLPLTGITHMASQEEVAENLLLLQVGFLRQALGVGSSPTP